MSEVRTGFYSLRGRFDTYCGGQRADGQCHPRFLTDVSKHRLGVGCLASGKWSLQSLSLISISPSSSSSSISASLSSRCLLTPCGLGAFSSFPAGGASPSIFWGKPGGGGRPLGGPGSEFGGPPLPGGAGKPAGGPPICFCGSCCPFGCPNVPVSFASVSERFLEYDTRWNLSAYASSAVVQRSNRAYHLPSEEILPLTCSHCLCGALHVPKQNMCLPSHFCRLHHRDIEDRAVSREEHVQ